MIGEVKKKIGKGAGTRSKRCLFDSWYERGARRVYCEYTGECVGKYPSLGIDNDARCQ